MELKTKYQYSYFIHPYIVKENEYSSYMLKLLKDKHCRLKILEKEKDLNIYTYFLPKVRDFMFWTFQMDSKKKSMWDELNTNLKAKLLAQYPCSIFEYELGDDVQGKIGEKNGIFFELSKIEIICFKTGICFILLKTSLDEEVSFSDLLNFNYKFRDINSEFVSLKDYENIKIQTNNLKDMKDLSMIIKSITGQNKGARELNLSEERFLTYSYVCVEQEYWNETNKFEGIKNEFIKFMNVMPYNSNVNLDKDWVMNNSVSLGEYAKIGTTKQAVALFTSSSNMQNYTKLLFSYEREYLYTYILELYKKIYLKKVAKGFTSRWKIVEARNSFLKFTDNIWTEEVTDDEIGLQLQKKLKEELEIEYLYNQIKQKYDIYYKDLNIRKSNKISYWIIFILISILIFNIINYLTFLSKS